jgi:predicted DNA-binding antitoxin AbrB/MazE fold protein
MSNSVEAIYENGILRPLSKLPIAEGERVIITVHPLPKTEEQIDPIYTIYEIAEESGIPDLATNIDHYLYGVPKKCL